MSYLAAAREERRRRRAIERAAAAYFEATHATGHLIRYPTLEDADFRAWVDYSGTGRDIAEEVGDAAALLAEQCRDCSISSEGELDDDEMYVKRSAMDERTQRRASGDDVALDLGLVDDPRKKLAERLGGFIPDELRDDDDLMRIVKRKSR